MTSIVVFAILALIVVCFSALSFFPGFAKKKKMKLLGCLSREGAANNLIFCSQEIFQNRVIGIDGIHRKIMVVEEKDHSFKSSIISLDEVSDCELVTNSGLLKRSLLKNVDSATDNASVEIRFQFNNRARPAFVRFGNGLINSRTELEFLNAKAAYWCVMFSKMLVRGIEARA
jgi:hypothetical protein